MVALYLALLLAGFASQEKLDTKAVAILFRQFETSDQALERLAAFESLKASEDPQIVVRLKKTVETQVGHWLKKGVTERTRALRALVAASRKKINHREFSGKQREALGLLSEGNTAKMEPVVRDLWEVYYFVPARAEEDEKLWEAVQRIKELNGNQRALGVEEKSGAEAKMEEAFRPLNETHLVEVMPDRDRKVMTQNASLRGQVSEEEFQLVFITNQYRVMMGMNALKLNPKLCAASREHSRDMHEHKFFDHISPLPGKRTFSDRAAKHGASGTAENIFMGDKRAEAAFWTWFQSVGHHRNIVRAHTELGGGNHEEHWTELFGGHDKE